MDTLLKKLRIKNKLSIKEIANQFGVCEKTIFNYENNEKTIPADILIKFSKLYRVSVDYILGLKDYNNIIFADKNNEVLAVVSQNEIVEHAEYKIILSVD